MNSFFSNLKHIININILYIEVQFDTKINTILLFTVAANICIVITKRVPSFMGILSFVSSALLIIRN